MRAYTIDSPKLHHVGLGSYHGLGTSPPFKLAKHLPRKRNEQRDGTQGNSLRPVGLHS